VRNGGVIDHLEELVKERTDSLTRLNEQLHWEIGERKKTEMKLRVKSRQLEELNKNLEKRVIQEIEKRRQKEQLLLLSVVNVEDGAMFTMSLPCQKDA